MLFSKTGHEVNGILEIRNREFKNSKITNRKLVVCVWSRQMHFCSSVTKKKVPSCSSQRTYKPNKETVVKEQEIQRVRESERSGCRMKSVLALVLILHLFNTSSTTRYPEVIEELKALSNELNQTKLTSVSMMFGNIMSFYFEHLQFDVLYQICPCKIVYRYLFFN